MKYSVILLCLALSVPMVSMAQGEVGSFSVMPKVGVCLANISGAEIVYTGETGDKTMKGKYNARLTAGVDVEYRAHELFGVVLGVAYSQQGCRYSNHEWKSEAISDSREKMDYLQIPLMGKVYLGCGFSAGVGVQLGVLLSDKMTYTVETITKDNDGNTIYNNEKKVEDDMKWARRKTDFSIPIGVSYEYNNVVVGARYNLGLGNLWKDDDFATEKSKAFTFTVGYRFVL